jgi:hypothetical protein
VSLDISEVTINVGLGVAIPGHKAAKFASKQDSLHALMVERERSEESFPYLLRAKFFLNAVASEDGHSISAVRPQKFESTIEQVFYNVTVIGVHGHPGALLVVGNIEVF